MTNKPLQVLSSFLLLLLAPVMTLAAESAEVGVVVLRDKGGAGMRPNR
jgi:hypothetical protein